MFLFGSLFLLFLKIFLYILNSIVYNTNELLQIVDLMLQDTKRALADKNITLDVTKKAKQILLEKGTDLKYGARPLRRAIQRYIEDDISEKIYNGGIKC